MIQACRFFLVVLVLFAAASSAHAGEKFPVQKYLNRFPADLAKVLDPKLRSAEADLSVVLENFKGWKSVIFSFNAKRRLVAIAVIPQSPLTEEAAMKIIEEDLGFVPRSRSPWRSSGSNSGLIAYRDMPGIVTTLNFHLHGTPPPGEVTEIGFFSKLHWTN